MTESKFQGRECAAVREVLVPYVDGELGSSEIEEVERHAAVCPACQAEIDAHRALSASLLRVLRTEGTSRLSGETVRRRAFARGASGRSWRFARWVAGAAALILAGWIGIVLRGGPGSPRDDLPSEDLLANLDILEDLHEEGLDPTPELVQWIAGSEGGLAGEGIEETVGAGADGELLDVFEYLLEEELAKDNM